MRLATALYLAGVFLFILFTDAIFGISGQSLAYAPLTAALLVLVVVALVAGPRDFLGRWYIASPMLVPGLLFITGLVISLPNARDLGLAAKDLARWSFVWLVFAPATRAICDGPRRCRLVTQAAGIFIVIFAVVAVGDLLTGGALTPGLIGRSGITQAGRYMSVYGNAGVFAGMLTVGLPLALVRVANPGRGSVRLLWLVGVAVVGAAMLLTGTRTTLLTAAVAAGIIFAAQRRWWLAGAVTLAIMAAAFTPVSAVLGGAPTVSRVQETVEGVGSGQRSLARRLLIWSLALEMIQEQPVFGRGGSQLRFAQHAGFKRAHNAWLDAWLDGGLPAALAMLVLTGLVLGRAWRTLLGRERRYRDPTHVGLVAASCAVLVGWTVRAGIGGRIDWFPIFLLFAACWDVTGAAEDTGEPQATGVGTREVLPCRQGS